MAVTGEENVYFEMDYTHKPDEHTYSHLVGRSETTTAVTNQSGHQECTQRRVENKQNSTEDGSMVSRKLLLIIAVFVALSFLATVVTMILTLMNTENASSPSADIAAFPGENGMFSELRQSLSEIKDEIRALKKNFSGGPRGNGLFSEVKQPLTEIKDEIRALKENLTGGPHGNGLFSEVKQPLTEIKDEIRALRENLTGGPGGNGILFELKTQLSEIQEGFRVLKENKTGVSSGGGTNVSGGVYKNCAEVYKSGKNISGEYKIDPDGLGEFRVYCDHNTAGGGWTVFQKRHDGSVDFYKSWNDYKRGFGFLNGEFWLGLDRIHRLTEKGDKKLRVDLGHHSIAAFEEYNFFVVGNETAKYKLNVGGYSGTAGDAFTYHRYQAFTTKDRDNDLEQNNNCAVQYTGAWWYKYCLKSNLNGQYLNGAQDNKGMVWRGWPTNLYTVTRSEMKIRPKDF